MCTTIKVLVFLCLVDSAAGQAKSGIPLGSSRSGTITVISGGTLIDGTGRPPLPDVTVIIEGERIREVGPSSSINIPGGARIIDASGKFVLPGLIDTHVHLEMVGLSDIGDLPAEWSAPAKLRELAAINARLDLLGGVTTVRDLGSTRALFQVREQINAGVLPGPRIIAAGMQLVKKAPGAESMFLEYDGPDDAREKVDSLGRLGADVIKIRLTQSRPVPSLQEVRAIVEEAHLLGLQATVHTDVPADELVRLAIDAGADGIEHNAPLRSQNGEILARMAEKGMSLMAGSGAFYIQRIDTTGLIGGLDPAQTRLLPADVISALRKGIDSLNRQTRQMRSSGWDPALRQGGFVSEINRARKAGVLLVFGTDCGAYGSMHGEQYKALYGESRMGSSPMQAILMATRDAAKAIGKSEELGTVEAGKLADLMIVNADPLKDLRHLRELFLVFKGGQAYDRK